MPLVTSSCQVSASIKASYRKPVTGFDDVTQQPELPAKFSPDTAVYNHVLAAQYTMAAAGMQVVDLYSLASVVDGAITITKLRGFLITASAVLTGGQLRIERDATDGWSGLFDHASDKLTLDVGAAADGCALLLWNGLTKVVSNTSKRILLTNAGSQSITALVYFVLGT